MEAGVTEQTFASTVPHLCQTANFTSWWRATHFQFVSVLSEPTAWFLSTSPWSPLHPSSLVAFSQETTYHLVLCVSASWHRRHCLWEPSDYYHYYLASSSLISCPEPAPYRPPSNLCTNPLRRHGLPPSGEVLQLRASVPLKLWENN